MALLTQRGQRVNVSYGTLLVVTLCVNPMSENHQKKLVLQQGFVWLLFDQMGLVLSETQYFAQKLLT